MEYVNIGRVRPIYKGEHNPELNYETLDVVRSKDGFTSYMAKKEVPAGTALTDEEYWGLMNQVKSDVVQYGSAQTLTGEQQDQARVNIGAARLEEVIELKDDLANSKKDIAELNDKKITKFYANNLGETNLPDSDNGKIVDMLIYGKSEQFQGEIELEDGTTVTVPCQDYPQEIKSVVNPFVKVYGKNLLDVSKATFEAGKAKLVDGEIYLNGTFDSNYDYYFFDAGNVALDLILKVNKTVTISCGSFNIGIWTESGIKTGKSIKINLIADRLISIFVIVLSGTYENFKVPIMIEIGDTVTDYEPYKEPQTETLPYTLNAIPVSSGGNVTIDGQQYIADYVDVESKKLVRMVDESKLDTTISIIDNTDLLLEPPTITDLTDEEVQALKELATYYPTTNVMVTSDQLDGYTTFNYPLSMANGWNLIKEQLGDTRDYIYDMDLQSAEAYVNSEYAVTLTELGV